MSRSFKTGIAFLFLSFLFFSCQKELSFEMGQLSQGTLQGDGGECLPKDVGGTFTAGLALGDTNYIEVTVDVLQTGAYTIGTDTVNGYYFRTTGNFGSIGANTVRLKGFGTPAAEGVNNFTVSYDSSACSVLITVLPGGGSGGTSSFTLEGAGGGCTNSTTAGTYTEGTLLTAANQVVLSVNVATLGTWTLTSNTVAGFSFSGSGTFTTLGVQNITLNASGTPTAAGQQTFSVSAGGGSCTFPVTVAPNTTPPAVYTLQGAGGNCSNSNVAGTYTQGTPLSGANTITIQVNVTTLGSYTITTNTVTGMSFTGSGNFTTLGVQNVTLNGSGTPTAAGLQVLTVTAGTATCTIDVTVVGGTTPTGDHFPLTANSWWSYNDPTAAGDTIKRMNDGTATGGGNTYRVFTEFDHIQDPVSEFYFRKDGNDYYEYTTAHAYALMTFDDPVPEGDILFLKEGIATGASWNSVEFTGTESGVATKLRYVFSCTDANGTATINGKNFTNVYKITFKPQISVSGGPYADEGLVWETWYAQGIGLIHMKGALGPNSIEWNIRSWLVN